MSSADAQFGAGVPASSSVPASRFLAWLLPAAERLGKLQTRLLMAIVYLFVIGPVALCLKLLGRDSLACERLGAQSLHARPDGRPELEEHLRRLY